MKKPKFLSKLAAILPSRPKKRYQVAARAARSPQIEEYDDGQPTTRLSSAFVVMLILHVVLVGGIYAFNSIKASRRNHAQIQAATSSAAAPANAAGDADSASVAAPVPAASPAVVHPAASHPATAAAAQPLVAAVTPAKLGGLRQHQVKAGDNLTKIAFAYRVTPSELLAANGLKDNAVLRIGQTLSIPASKSEAGPLPAARKAETPAKLTDIPPTRTTPGIHIVKKGDTAHSIARSYGMTADELIKLNKIADPKKLQLGQALKIPPRKI